MQPPWQQERGDMNAAAVARETPEHIKEHQRAAIVINATVKNICTK